MPTAVLEKDEDMSRRAAVSSASNAMDVEGGSGSSIDATFDDDKRSKSAFSAIATFSQDSLPKTTFAGAIIGTLIATVLVSGEWLFRVLPPPFPFFFQHTLKSIHSRAISYFHNQFFIDRRTPE